MEILKVYALRLLQVFLCQTYLIGVVYIVGYFRIGTYDCPLIFKAHKNAFLSAGWTVCQLSARVQNESPIAFPASMGSSCEQ